jgi:polyphosphate glucokinase
MKKILVIDVGGSHVKVLASGQTEERKFISGPTMTAQDMVEKVTAAAADWSYDAISMGYPGPVAKDKPLLEPRNLGQGWVGFDFAKQFGRPVKIMNDAAMQALGSYDGGCMLFLGLGTGLGSALIIDTVVAPLELAHLPYKKGRTFEDYVGERGLERLGRKKWEEAVHDVVARLKNALVADYVVLGGGNSRRIKNIPPDARMGDNRNAFVGGFRMWDRHARESRVSR